jgi:hypothetical protein
MELVAALVIAAIVWNVVVAIDTHIHRDKDDYR